MKPISLVYQFIVENEPCTMKNMSKTLKMFPGTLKPIVYDLYDRQMIDVIHNPDGEIIMEALEPDGEWTKESLTMLLEMY